VGTRGYSAVARGRDVRFVFAGAEAVRRTLDLRNAMHSLPDAHAKEIELATNAGDIGASRS
jgi:hypothetical protein